MRTNSQRRARRGAVMVLLVVCLLPILAFLVLAIDLGVMAIARTQCQSIADAGAMAGARKLDGNSNNSNNYAAVAPTVNSVAAANQVLGAGVSSAQVTAEIGRFVYNTSLERFEGQFPGPSNENWSMVRTVVQANVTNNMTYAKMLSLSPPLVQATSIAAHRPRDVAVILDFSGSMRFASLLGQPYSGARTTNNPDTVVPSFGHYSSSNANLVATSFTSPYDQANLTSTTADGRPAICANFYQDASGTPAFTPASEALATNPAGDNYLRQSFDAGSAYATTVAQVLNLSGVTNSTRNSGWETDGYQHQGMRASFDGYTQGPGYWGKTFFIWPPDPRTTADWRRLYFSLPGANSSDPFDNSRLWDSNGNWLAPNNSNGGYAINYDAILAWIKSGPQVFPPTLRSGRIVYYDQIPDTIDTSSYTPADLNQRFWKQYIDYVLGLWQTSSGNWTIIASGSGSNAATTGYGADYTFGTRKITAAASLQATGNPPKKPYMHYEDNPRRPRLHFWFGPLSLVDFLGNYNLWGNASPTGSMFCWWPGTCHEAPMYGCKLGIRAALSDIRNNHPNDLVSMIFFSVPATSASNSSGGRFNRVRVGLGRDYSRMEEALWYPPSTLGNANATVRMHDSQNLEVPRAYGGTCYAMPLMLAYNQFSTNSTLRTFNTAEPTGDAGGNGRKGAQKIVIFETDGLPNTTASAAFQSAGSHKSYYKVRFTNGGGGSSEYPTGVSGYGDNHSTVVSQIQSVCQRLCALESDGQPGYSTGSKPVLIHCLGFGPIFEPDSPSRASAIQTLDAMQAIGGLGTKEPTLPEYKIIVGDQATMVTRMQQAITKILQDGVQVSLIH